MVAAARLSERVVLERRTAARTPSGGVTNTWSVLATVWAEVTTRRASESLVGPTMESTAGVEIVTHWRTDIAADDRVVHNGRPYDILHIAPVDRKKRFMVLHCQIGNREGA